MQGNRGGRDPFFDFGDPFGGFGGFDGFDGHRSLVSSFFGGRDPFDDPFFRQPFGGMFGPGPFGSMPSPFMGPAGGFIEHNPPQPKRSRGPIIEELNSDDDRESNQGEEGNPRKQARSIDGSIVGGQSPQTGGSINQLQSFDDYRNRQSQGGLQPRGQSYTFQSSYVTYGGANGPYYTSSTTRRSGGDGVVFEESKEADSSTMQANHRVSRGLHGRGHSVMRKLNSDGRVDTKEALHNLEQDDLAGFEEAWKGNAQKHLPGWLDHSSSFNGHGGSSSREALALPSTERSAPGVAQQTGVGASTPFHQSLSELKKPQPGIKSRGKTRRQ